MTAPNVQLMLYPVLSVCLVLGSNEKLVLVLGGDTRVEAEWSSWPESPEREWRRSGNSVYAYESEAARHTT
ncbi:hypothetical protein GOODEAATRI_020422 [Goodea atripinnis]|uniref:Secreted protein n=1 Tax=Goodea atripinnis TaxID=208336 RepID=A0ABV0NC71_9TELE